MGEQIKNEESFIKPDSGIQEDSHKLKEMSTYQVAGTSKGNFFPHFHRHSS